MPKRSSKKRSRDPNVLAAEIVAEATAEERKPDAEDRAGQAKEGKVEEADGAEKPKNPHAQALGRLGGKKGGRARAAKLTAKRRREIARIAARARWKKSD